MIVVVHSKDEKFSFVAVSEFKTAIALEVETELAHTRYFQGRVWCWISGDVSLAIDRVRPIVFLVRRIMLGDNFP